MRAKWLWLAVLSGCSTEGVSQGEYEALVDRVDALEADNTALRAELQAKADATALHGYASDDALAAVQAEIVTLQADAGTLEGEVASLGDEVEAQRDALAAQDDAVAAIEAEVQGVSSASIQRIGANVTIGVPGQFATLDDALIWLDGSTIDRSARVTIQLAPGTYAFAQTLVFSHPSGGRIQILGDVNDPSAVVLKYTGGGRAIRVPVGGSLGLFDGITLRGEDKPNTVGIEASDGGSFFTGSSVVVEHFGGAAFRALRGGRIFAAGASAIENAGDGFVAVHGGVITAPGALAQGNGGGGFVAWNAGVIAADAGAEPTTAIDNDGVGFGAWAGSAITATGALSSGNETGFVSENNSMVTAVDATAELNDHQGFWTNGSSTIVVDGATATGNETGFGAGASSALLAWGGATSVGNRDGFQAGGNSFVGLNGGPVTSTDDGVFGFNAFWGGWMEIGADTTGTNSGVAAYNIGPWSNASPLPDPTGWGVIWREEPHD